MSDLWYTRDGKFLLIFDYFFDNALTDFVSNGQTEGVCSIITGMRVRFYSLITSITGSILHSGEQLIDTPQSLYYITPSQFY